MIPASFVPNSAPLPLLARLYQKVAHIHTSKLKGDICSVTELVFTSFEGLKIDCSFRKFTLSFTILSILVALKDTREMSPEARMTAVNQKLVAVAKLYISYERYFPLGECVSVIMTEQ